MAGFGKGIFLEAPVVIFNLIFQGFFKCNWFGNIQLKRDLLAARNGHSRLGLSNQRLRFFYLLF